jgi:hypothetical protein
MVGVETTNGLRRRTRKPRVYSEVDGFRDEWALYDLNLFAQVARPAAEDGREQRAVNDKTAWLTLDRNAILEVGPRIE